jgi:CO/xanthine dehydrogenase Mo-binding subunit
MSEAIDYKVVGSRPIRPDGVDKVTGRANFGADFKLPGMLYSAFARSPHAHARIKSIDTDKAAAMEGVRAIVTGADFPSVAHEEITGAEGGGDFGDLAVNTMARLKALYHGHPVAAVAATSQRLADAAAAAISVEYQVLEPVMTLDAALADGATLINEHLYTKGLPEKPDAPSNVAAVMELTRGDLDQGFAEADVIVEDEFRTPTVHQGYIEPHACLATINQGGQATVWCCTQGHFDVRSLSAKVLGMNVADIKVIPSEIGGGFGGKTTVYLEPVAILLSKITGRPVKMTMTREEVFRASGPASASVSRIKIGAKNDGTITAVDAWLGYEAGAFPGSPMGPGVMCAITPYPRWVPGSCVPSPPTRYRTSVSKAWTCW